MCSQTLGTALGDWTADTAGIGYGGGIMVLGGALTFVLFAYWFTKISRTFLFWAAFILTRPLGAVVGDFLDQPRGEGGLELCRFAVSAVLVALMAGFIFAFSHKPAKPLVESSPSREQP